MLRIAEGLGGIMHCGLQYNQLFDAFFFSVKYFTQQNMNAYFFNKLSYIIIQHVKCIYFTAKNIYILVKYINKYIQYRNIIQLIKCVRYGTTRQEKLTSVFRETNVRQHNGVLIEAPLKTLDTTVPRCSKGFRGALKQARETSVSQKAVRLTYASSVSTPAYSSLF